MAHSTCLGATLTANSTEKNGEFFEKEMEIKDFKDCCCSTTIFSGDREKLLLDKIDHLQNQNKILKDNLRESEILIKL
jgi:hypothetical protein